MKNNFSEENICMDGTTNPYIKSIMLLFFTSSCLKKPVTLYDKKYGQIVAEVYPRNAEDIKIDNKLVGKKANKRKPKKPDITENFKLKKGMDCVRNGNNHTDIDLKE